VSGGLNVTSNIYVAQEPETLKYDADGNLTNDGHWAYVWDGENRLIQMSVNANLGPQYMLNFVYDPNGRRIQKVVSTNGVGLYTNNVLYDGWNLVATLSSSASVINSFMWGSDLSGSFQGAGGVGGLLEVSYYGSITTNCFPAFDGNGNVSALINVTDGTLAANYEYGVFGEQIRITGTMAKNNPLRFSTQYSDDESDLLYYGYRYYKSSTGSWLNRDPSYDNAFITATATRPGGVTTEGGNLYMMANNDSCNSIDVFGMLGYHTFIKPSWKPCGNYFWSILWDAGPTELEGYIIQKVTIRQNPRDCTGKYLEDYPAEITYYEAWQVPDSKYGLNDTFRHKSYGSCTYGHGSTQGTAAFFWISTLPSSFAIGNVPEAGYQLPSSYSPPWYWGKSASWISNYVTRGIFNVWTCCNGNSSSYGAIY
jgi:RHS repeat-associated protein